MRITGRNKAFMKIKDYIKSYTEKGHIPFHMPGHKRNIGFAPYLEAFGADFDMTEIYGMDDLHSPNGIILESMHKAERLWNSEKSFFLINGSTAGILSAIRACTHYGDEILVARNCHKSVYNAVELCGLKPSFILPEIIEDFSVYGSVSPDCILSELKKNRNIKLVVLTSPTYEGIISDIKSIAELAHMFGIPVLADEAHGAHLDLSEYFTGGAVRAGADIVVQSLHKTLPSLTQTGLLHVNSKLIDAKAVQKELSVFQTSSPSYILMSSIDECIENIQDKTLFYSWKKNLDLFRLNIAGLKKLSVIDYTSRIGEYSNIFAFDRSKIVICTEKTNISGLKLADVLRQNYGIETEMSAKGYVIAMTSVADSLESFERLADALIDIDRRLLPVARKNEHTLITEIPEKAENISEASSESFRNIYYKNAVNKVSAEHIWIYPPGIPIIAPGEVICDDTVRVIETAVNNNMNLQHTLSYSSENIAVR